MSRMRKGWEGERYYEQCSREVSIHGYLFLQLDEGREQFLGGVAQRYDLFHNANRRKAGDSNVEIGERLQQDAEPTGLKKRNTSSAGPGLPYQSDEITSPMTL